MNHRKKIYDSRLWNLKGKLRILSLAEYRVAYTYAVRYIIIDVKRMYHLIGAAYSVFLQCRLDELNWIELWVRSIEGAPITRIMFHSECTGKSGKTERSTIHQTRYRWIERYSSGSKLPLRNVRLPVEWTVQCRSQYSCRAVATSNAKRLC